MRTTTRQREAAALPKSVARKIDMTGDCWPWTGRIDRHGYGRYHEAKLAHRVVYELLVGPIPDGLQLDHLCHTHSDCKGGPTCRHRRCVNPIHLEVVTDAENRSRGFQVRKTRCVNGHPYDEQNTYLRRDGDGRRYCRACNLIAKAAYRARKRAAA